MSESRFDQLRFDISEKVRLHPQQPGIGTLLELDLYPDVEIKDEGKHLKIHGYLRLNGLYLGEGEKSEAHLHKGSQTKHAEDLAYVIPVEITIPADRAKVDAVLAEVETFDYSVISPFELQVEAILLIDGILPEEQKESNVAKADEILTEEIDEQPSFTAKPIEEKNENTMSENVTEQNEFKEYLGTPGEDEKSIQRSSDNHSRRPELHFSFNHEEKKSENKEKIEPSSVEYLNDIWTKKREGMVGDSETDFSQDQFAMEKEIDPHVNSKEGSLQGKIREVEWIHWLVQNKEESFAPMRMVIVQKDESIDTIAERYGLSVGHLMRLNELEDDSLSEGQIMYVPRRVQVTS